MHLSLLNGTDRGVSHATVRELRITSFPKNKRNDIHNQYLNSHVFDIPLNLKHSLDASTHLSSSIMKEASYINFLYKLINLIIIL